MKYKEEEEEKEIKIKEKKREENTDLLAEHKEELTRRRRPISGRQKVRERERVGEGS